MSDVSPSADGLSIVRNVGQRSLTSQAREAILESIMDDRFEGGRIPPEKELAEMLGVSRTTVRSALQSLQDAGVIARTRGRGTTVRKHANPSALALHRLVGFPSLLEESGKDVSVETDLRETESLSQDVARILGVAQNEPSFLFERLFGVDGDPAIWLVHTCPAANLREGWDRSNGISEWFDFMERYGKQRVDHAVVDIRAECAAEVTAEKLSLAEGAPLIVLYETHYSATDEPLAYSQISVSQKHVTFRVLRTN